MKIYTDKDKQSLFTDYIVDDLGYAQLPQGVYYAYEGSYISAHEGATVNAYKGSWVNAYEGATVNAYKGSYIGAFKGATVNTHKGSCIGAHEGATVHGIFFLNNYANLLSKYIEIDFEQAKTYFNLPKNFKHKF